MLQLKMLPLFFLLCRLCYNNNRNNNFCLVGCLTFFYLFLLQTSSDIFFIHKLILPILVRILMVLRFDWWDYSVTYYNKSMWVANFFFLTSVWQIRTHAYCFLQIISCISSFFNIWRVPCSNFRWFCKYVVICVFVWLCLCLCLCLVLYVFVYVCVAACTKVCGSVCVWVVLLYLNTIALIFFTYISNILIFFYLE